MQESTADLATRLERQLFEKHGPLLGGSALHVVLGFKSAGALRQATLRDQIGVKLFSIANRRGKFALTLHVAQWLAECAMPGDADASVPEAGPARSRSRRAGSAVRVKVTGPREASGLAVGH